MRIHWTIGFTVCKTIPLVQNPITWKGEDDTTQFVIPLYLIFMFKQNVTKYMSIFILFKFNFLAPFPSLFSFSFFSHFLNIIFHIPGSSNLKWYRDRADNRTGSLEGRC